MSILPVRRSFVYARSPDEAIGRTIKSIRNIKPSEDNVSVMSFELALEVPLPRIVRRASLSGFCDDLALPEFAAV